MGEDKKGTLKEDIYNLNEKKQLECKTFKSKCILAIKPLFPSINRKVYWEQIDYCLLCIAKYYLPLK